jgi:hypothetical protein
MKKVGCTTKFLQVAFTTSFLPMVTAVAAGPGEKKYEGFPYALANTLILIAIVSGIWTWFRKTTLYNNFLRRLNKSNPMKLAREEFRLGEIYVQTRDITHGGFMSSVAVNSGKLVLTNQRLTYTTHDEQRNTLVLNPDQITQIESGTEGIKGETPILTLTFHAPGQKHDKKIIWQVPQEVNPFIRGVISSTEKVLNSHTAESFASLISDWRAGRKAPQSKTAPGENVKDEESEKVLEK